MGKTLIRSAKIWDATGAKPFAGDMLIEGDRIQKIAKEGSLPSDGCDVIDAKGMFLMPRWRRAL